MIRNSPEVRKHLDHRTSIKCTNLRFQGGDFLPAEKQYTRRVFKPEPIAHEPYKRGLLFPKRRQWLID